MQPDFTQLEKALPLDKSNGGKDVVSARALHACLEVATRFADWFARRVEEYGFKKDVDFCSILSKSTGGRPEADYALALDMAKELGMVERTDKGREIRQYFIWAEKRLKAVAAAPMALPADYAGALRMLADNVEETARLQAQIEAAAPKVAFADAVTAADGAVPMANAAKVLALGFGRNILFAKLRADHILMRDNEPYQQYVDCGWFRVVARVYQTPAGGKLKSTTLVTGKGLAALLKRYKK